jgi:hypothetical protein
MRARQDLRDQENFGNSLLKQKSPSSRPGSRSLVLKMSRKAMQIGWPVWAQDRLMANGRFGWGVGSEYRFALGRRVTPAASTSPAFMTDSRHGSHCLTVHSGIYVNAVFKKAFRIVLVMAGQRHATVLRPSGPTRSNKLPRGLLVFYARQFLIQGICWSMWCLHVRAAVLQNYCWSPADAVLLPGGAARLTISCIMQKCLIGQPRNSRSRDAAVLGLQPVVPLSIVLTHLDTRVCLPGCRWRIPLSPSLTLVVLYLGSYLAIRIGLC